MQKAGLVLLVFSFYLFVATTSTDAEPVVSRISDTVSHASGHATKWTGRVETLFLDRTQSYRGLLVVDEDNASMPVMTGHQIDFDTEAGIRASLSRHVNEDDVIQFEYFGVDQWEEFQLALGNNNRSLPGDLGLATFDFFSADAISTSYGSDVASFEINYRSELGDFAALAGFRYVRLDEQFAFESFDADTFQSDFVIETQNDLYGGQIGGEVTLREKNWTFSVLGKAGIFGNDNEQVNRLRDLGNTVVIRDAAAEDTTTSFVGDLRASLSASLCKRVDLIASYNLLWITDVALAPYQIDFTDTTTSGQFIDDGHSVFMHGASVGVQAKF